LAARSDANPIVVEADPAGGDLQARFGVRGEPGLSDFAADTATGGRELRLEAYAQQLDGLGVPVVFGPADEYQPTSSAAGLSRDRAGIGESGLVVGMVARSGLEALRHAAAERLVVLDVGRLSWDSPALPLAAGADVWLLVAHATVDGLDAVRVRRERLLALPDRRAALRLVLRGAPPYPPAEIEQVVRLPVAATLPDDRRGAALLTGRARPGWGWTRTELMRAARALAVSLTAPSATRTGQLRPVPPVIHGQQTAGLRR
jgi:hypothetical protein